MNLEGKVLGTRYEIIEKIGNGGMATVYKSMDLVLKRNRGTISSKTNTSKYSINI